MEEVTIGVSTLKPVKGDQSFEFTIVDTTLQDGRVAVEGEDYELASTSFTIPADSTQGSIPLTVIKDNVADNPVLFLEITSNNAASYNTVIAITLRQFFPYNQQDFVGEWELTYPWWFGNSQPVPVQVVAAPNDDKNLIVQNMLGTGTDIEFVMDDSDPANFTVTFDKEVAWVSGQYGDVRMQGSGTFDADNIAISGEAEHTVSAGTFGAYPFSMEKVQTP
jgi:hypothetical protein